MGNRHEEGHGHHRRHDNDNKIDVTTNVTDKRGSTKAKRESAGLLDEDASSDEDDDKADDLDKGSKAASCVSSPVEPIAWLSRVNASAERLLDISHVEPESGSGRVIATRVHNRHSNMYAFSHISE